MKNTSKNKNFMPRFWRLIRNLIILFFATSIGWVILARFIPVYLTPLMIIRSVEALADGKTPRNSKDWVPIDKISPNMVQAVVASEDNLFLEHHGFSFTDINKAIKHNKRGKRIRGGSTISQQTAKNVFLWPRRSYLRKGLEAYFTVLIELFWSKERIMEVYLNVIETGDGTYGVEAASQRYFGKSAKNLTKSQAALIAACLPNPRRFNAGNPSGYILRRESKIISLMGKIEQVDFDKKGTSDEKSRKRKRK
ncbi:MAG: monofunctional biosynthetic peptidoglycan transglycosylase [Bacteroidales bacterium]|nr:monofunctional biosynthetic peptidoglycan transglycosylase [Bacteroidales bacterium]